MAATVTLIMGCMSVGDANDSSAYVVATTTVTVNAVGVVTIDCSMVIRRTSAIDRTEVPYIDSTYRWNQLRS